MTNWFLGKLNTPKLGKNIDESRSIYLTHERMKYLEYFGVQDPRQLSQKAMIHYSLGLDNDLKEKTRSRKKYVTDVQKTISEDVNNAIVALQNLTQKYNMEPKDVNDFLNQMQMAKCFYWKQ